MEGTITRMPPLGYVVKSLADRFDEKVQKTDRIGCWTWLGFVDKGGYARIREGGRATPVLYAHRYVYERFVGPIPDGLHIDHLCRNRACVNPEHMEPVTSAENSHRGAQARLTCWFGHDKETHGYFYKGRYHHCRTCQRARRAQ